MAEAVAHLVDELAAGDVHAVHDGVLLAAQDAVGLTAGLQHVRLRVLLHHKLRLLQQGVQVLHTHTNTRTHTHTHNHQYKQKRAVYLPTHVLNYIAISLYNVRIAKPPNTLITNSVTVVPEPDLLHASSTVHIQVKELGDLQEVAHLLRICLVLRKKQTEIKVQAFVSHEKG